ncbi:MAG: LicD family protein [Akkermansiaceae bacterium]|nr:LicD family protein [Akkermansiaceae bacterium]
MNADILKKLQLKELQILKEVIKVCNELGIQYFAAYGTALGAVRHKGFIPWDDDIDLGMKREDFDRFIREAPALLPPHLFVQYRDTDPDYNILHAKVRDTSTAFLEPGWEHNRGNQGIFIDIFPWDYHPKNAIRSLIFGLRKRYYQNIISTKKSVSYHWKQSGIKNKLRALLVPLVNLFYSDRQKAARKMDNMLRSLKPSSIICDQEFRKLHYPAEWFEGTISVPFEDISINIPTGCHEYLSKRYGDYMKYPPIEDQAPRHFGGIVDTEKSYTYYVSAKNEQQHDS